MNTWAKEVVDGDEEKDIKDWSGDWFIYHMFLYIFCSKFGKPI